MLGKKIILVGYSGHATALADVALNNKLNIIGYTESSLKNNNPYGFSYLGDENNDDFFGWSENEIAFLIGIGANVIREKIFRLILSKKKEVLKLISTSALVSNSSLIVNVSSPLSWKVIQYCLLSTLVTTPKPCSGWLILDPIPNIFISLNFYATKIVIFVYLIFKKND